MPIAPRQGWGSLDPSLHKAFSLGRSMGLSDLGTYNPASRLPSGDPSDHARYPAGAFDLGVTPAIGMQHPVGRVYFEAMVGRPEVEYVILGDVIWSRARGRHRYTAGEHMNHVHVSGVRGLAGSTDRRAPSGRLSEAQLAAMWVAAGGNPRQAAMAGSVAWLESRGNPRAHRVTSREDSRGPWQINVLAHPEYASRDLFNPAVNAQAAVRISRNGTNWAPWTTASAARARVAAGTVGGLGGRGVALTRPGGEGVPFGGVIGGIAGGVGGAAGDVLGGVTGVFKQAWQWGEALVALVAFIVNPLNWLRAIEVLFGFTLMLVGLASLVVLFSRPESPVAQLARLSPAGRVGGAVRRGAAA